MEGITLHIFNPSHDEALAANSPYYYPSTAARRLACEKALLPSIWANENDAILLPTNNGIEALDTFQNYITSKNIHTICPKGLTPNFWKEFLQIDPWGWDLLLVHRLKKLGAPSHLLPDIETLQRLRLLSSRQTTSIILPVLRKQLEMLNISTVGDSYIIHKEDDVTLLLRHWKALVLKSLWSCSGRGIFRIIEYPSQSDIGRLRRILREQGGIEAEPFYSKICDFALEFNSDKNGIHFLGFSLFDTHSFGQYLRNIQKSQDEILSYLYNILPNKQLLSLLPQICQEILQNYFSNKYVGPLGIDMMLVAAQNIICIHPCVEINLRRTMGHVALCMNAQQ